ncbi:MAG: hypothetical protein FJX25_07360 [Alphaproteobacteria bacterium]|nr:hypothetical protein [Alphaproteobacteria bacterium]
MTLLHPLAAGAAGLVLSVAALTTAQEPEQGMPTLHPACAASVLCPPVPAAFQVGDIALPEDLHLISRPGLYGLGVAPPGSHYAILDGQIIRVELATSRIRSILRVAPATLD